MMIKTFSKIVTKDNKHLKLFYLIVPALSINYVEYVSRGKEQINKKLSSKAFLYDDGFVLGLSYFITLLKQNDHYRTMHWENAADVYFSESKTYSKDQTDSSSHSAKFK
jgi:WASH complex subunit 7